MTERETPAKPWSLQALFKDIEQIKHESVQGQGLDPRLVVLRAFQTDRLRRTYADLQARPAYRPALEFFLQDVYSAKDFTQRNHDMEHMYQILQRRVPDAILRPMVLTVDLHYLTEALDLRLSETLTEKLGVTDSITIPQYAEGYRLCDNYAERVRQIDLFYEIGDYLGVIVKMPLSGMVLNVAGGVLDRAGWTDLMEFLTRGYRAFKQMPSARALVETIRKRERRILDRIYASDPDPFGFAQAESGSVDGPSG